MRPLVIFLSFFLHTTVNAENIKIGFIDSEKVIANLTQYKNSVEKLSLEFEPKKKELLNLYEHIELLRNNIESNKKNLTMDAFESELIKLADLEESFEKETEFWQQSINSKKINLLKKIEILINKTINKLALDEGYDLILYKDVVFVSDKVNITEKIIEKIENSSPWY